MAFSRFVSCSSWYFVFLRLIFDLQENQEDDEDESDNESDEYDELYI